MKRMVKILLPVLLPLFLSCGMGDNLVTLEANRGKIDLSSLEFDDSTVYKLNGEWEFYWNELLSPSGLNMGKAMKIPDYFQMPGTWNGREHEGRVLSGEGYATYRLRIGIGDHDRRMALLVKEMATSYKLWVDGRLLSANGVVGKSPDSTRPQFMPRVLFFQPVGNTVEIVMQIANFSDNDGGAWHSIFLGSERAILGQRYMFIAIDVFLFGILFIMSIYHFGLYFLRRNDKSTLYFAMFSFLIAVRTFFLGERLVIFLFPGFNWELALKIEHLTGYIGLPVFLLFIYSLFREEMSKLFVRAVIIAGCIFTFVTIVTSGIVHTSMLPVFQLLMLVSIIYIIYVLLKVIYRGRVEGVIMALGFLFLAITLINDVLYSYGIVNTGYIVSFGLFLFLFAQSFVLSTMFSNLFKRNESLSVELQEKNIEIERHSLNLEEKVRERTEVIMNQKESLEEQIRLAQDIQQSLLPADFPTIDGVDLAYRYEPMLGVGGDFLDCCYNGEEGLGLFICDVSGHGVAGAFLSSMVKMSLNNWNLTLSTPEKTLHRIHSDLNEKMNGYFVSACICYFDLNSSQMCFSTAGHPPLILVREGGDIELHRTGGKIINSFFKPEYSSETIDLEKGDMIILYTDGITESRNGEGHMLGEEGFLDIIRKNTGNSSSVICENIIKDLSSFAGISDGKFEDDVTVMVIQFS